jgi:hypothetical protein
MCVAVKLVYVICECTILIAISLLYKISDPKSILTHIQIRISNFVTIRVHTVNSSIWLNDVQKSLSCVSKPDF